MEFISSSTKTIIKEGLKNLYTNLNVYELEFIKAYPEEVV